MYWLKLIFLILWLTGPPCESDACESWGEASLSHIAAVRDLEDADASEKGPSSSEHAHLVQRIIKRKPDASLLLYATQSVSLCRVSRPFGYFHYFCTVGEGGLTSLYRFLGVYLC